MPDIVLTQEEQRQFLREAAFEAARSPDPSTTNGAVLVGFRQIKSSTYFSDIRSPDTIRVQATTLASGYNTFPIGTYTTRPECFERPQKYLYIEHAERNAIYDAARKGICTKGLILICLWVACADCARAIINAGIKEILTLPHEPNERWNDSIEVGMEMFKDASIKINYYNEEVFERHQYNTGDVRTKLLRNGEVWQP